MPRHRLLPACAPRVLAALALAAPVLSPALASPALVDEAALRAWVTQQFAATAAREGFTRWEVQLGTVESASTLAPCRRIDPFLPTGLRGWGRTSVGLRCVEGAAWTVLMPMTVSVWGSAPVAVGTLPAGTVLGAQDLQSQELELTREHAASVRDPQALAGRTLMRAVAAGQPVRLDMTRVTTVVNTGDPVRLKLVGAGFAITASGQALASAGEGQPVRVRTELGKILTGVAREGRIIEVSL